MPKVASKMQCKKEYLGMALTVKINIKVFDFLGIQPAV
jgi:hypothetical protein